jgi:hypothetical protein
MRRQNERLKNARFASRGERARRLARLKNATTAFFNRLPTRSRRVYESRV